MKNNSLAMLAVISLTISVASIIGYIDPAVCAGLKSEGIEPCVQAAQQHVWAFWGFGAFGAITLVAGSLRARRLRAK